VTLNQLPRIVTVAAERPEVGGPDHPMRRVTSDTAFAPESWTPERAAKVGELFDSLAPTWKERDGPERHASVLDALDRGGPFPAGPCVEVGSGAGVATPVLVGALRDVISLDLSFEMLALAGSEAPRVRADCSVLPLRSRSVAMVALVNMFLFPGEVDRVLEPDGVLLWVSTLGDATPIYLPPADVLRALPGAWDGVTADAGWGTWLVARRAAA
jgi:SAM-dependent methyltransferase